ncbi:MULTISPECIES: hypothetical protein [Mammaliicoccus]|uniref:Lipoprotein n=1 Tax=Mammaliicoccus lentus TaxID=42858 RepID=A0AAP1WMH4_MAMLE|nr:MULTISPECIES: hypothetical protein [Mammaliicoccus]HBV03971.1 hypothetical protein [Staphylococcus sp.]MBF0747834.1 hypothetical protein [Mammaliicoccus lentus]MBF0842219.1 hypothetical protein [Mammaliicoccus lentus]MBU6113939.1 hypothetical protein [Mammaliicoccus lentus]MBW0761544.1 hypothetical protein [Mammaliicoccus lentus]
MDKQKRIYILLFTCVLLLSACAFPDKEKAENQVPAKDQLSIVQTAVDEYQKANDGLLPIKERDDSYSIYLQHPVDFNKLKPKFISQLPGNSFENGGIYQYVIMDVDKDPTVYLIDLRTSEVLKDIRIRIDASGEPLQLGDKVAPNVYEIDYKKYGFKKKPTVPSPYSNERLPVYMNGGNDFIIDYRLDLSKEIKKRKDLPKPGTDIRKLLYEDSPVLPAYSPEFTINSDKEPVFKSKVKNY